MSEKVVSPLADLAKAYTRAWAEVQNVVKNAHNPHHKSDYADLSAVIDTVKGVFAKHGLALLQSPGVITDVSGVLCQELRGVLMHESGQHIPMNMQLPLGTLAKPTQENDPKEPWKKPKGGDINAQKAGGVLTYARRYQMAAVAGIAQVDDDGNQASGHTQEEQVDTRALEKEIAATDSLEVLDGTGKGKSFVESDLRKRVQATGDKALIDKFVARRGELKKAKKATKEQAE